MLPNLASPRLQLVPVSDGDLELMRNLNADEAVMRHLTGAAASEEETDAEWAQRLKERSDPHRGLGYWLGRYDGVFAGWWGLGACTWDRSTANLGYRLSPAFWKRGLATEGSEALLRHAFETVDLASVWASTTPGNSASRRVLSKLSMAYAGVEYGQDQYRLTAAEWTRANDG